MKRTPPHSLDYTMEDRSKAKEVSTVILQALRSEGPVVTIERAEVYTDADGDTMSLTLLSQSGSRRTSASAPAIMEVSSTVVAASAASVVEAAAAVSFN